MRPWRWITFSFEDLSLKGEGWQYYSIVSAYVHFLNMSLGLNAPTSLLLIGLANTLLLVSFTVSLI